MIGRRFGIWRCLVRSVNSHDVLLPPRRAAPRQVRPVRRCLIALALHMRPARTPVTVDGARRWWWRTGAFGVLPGDDEAYTAPSSSGIRRDRDGLVSQRRV